MQKLPPAFRSSGPVASLKVDGKDVSVTHVDAVLLTTGLFEEVSCPIAKLGSPKSMKAWQERVARSFLVAHPSCKEVFDGVAVSSVSMATNEHGHGFRSLYPMKKLSVPGAHPPTTQNAE